jgi:putative PIN family toxin of toxin-antitoxin system
MKRIILDTNLWISFLISNNFNSIDTLFVQRKLKLIFSKELLDEFLSVALRPKFKKYFNETDVNKLLSVIEFYGELISISSKINLCRDPKDDFLLDLANDGEADYIVTGDLDLLELKRINKTKIITFNELLQEVNKL